MLTRRGLLLQSAGAAAANSGSSLPNILLLVMDHVRACELGCYGGGVNVPTPHLDRLAREGTRFANALSICPLSTPYRAMLQTGLPPLTTGAIVNGLNIATPATTLAGVFAQAGYVTSYIGKWHLAAGRLARDAASNRHPEYIAPGPARMGYQNWYAYNFHTEFARGYFYRDQPRRLLMPGYETDAEIVMANEVMHECRLSNQRFFLVVSPHPPHPPWRESHAPAGAWEKVPQNLHERANVKQTPAPGDLRCYYAQLANLDENLGKMLAYLDKNDMTANTLIVATSVQGEMLGSHGLWGTAAPYEEAVQVPLLIRWPGRVAPGAVDDTIVTPLDLLPMLKALTGLAPRPTRVRDAALLAGYTGHPEQAQAGGEWRAVRDTRYTYIRWRNGETAFYDNRKDPLQTRNLGRSKTYAQKLERLLRQFNDPFAGGDTFAARIAALRT